jgi:hypothetical protein
MKGNEWAMIGGFLQEKYNKTHRATSSPIYAIKEGYEVILGYGNITVIGV